MSGQIFTHAGSCQFWFFYRTMSPNCKLTPNCPICKKIGSAWLTWVIKPLLLHFHGFDPGLLLIGTVVTPTRFGPGFTLSTVLLRCRYGARGRSTEDQRVRSGYAKELPRFITVFWSLCYGTTGRGWATAVLRFVPDMLRCYGNATDLLRIFIGYVAALSRSLAVWSFIPIWRA